MRRRLPQRHALAIRAIPRVRLLGPNDAARRRRGHGHALATRLDVGITTACSSLAPPASDAAAFRSVCRSLCAAAPEESPPPPETSSVRTTPPTPGDAVAWDFCAPASLPEPSWSDEDERPDLTSDLSFSSISGMT
ncbi:hypothetical protein PG993_013301 [Apiospora rasikravindrae]|uniref:Uncharacterized protein n=1 Tax=Apiospora rasikravindrae TaxID=990691 RepID=A0ABR1RZD5_9PEZI